MMHSTRSFESYVRSLQFDGECIVAGLYDGSCQIAYFANRSTRKLPTRQMCPRLLAPLPTLLCSVRSYTLSACRRPSRSHPEASELIAQRAATPQP